jgi:hypothetical protein
MQVENQHSWDAKGQEKEVSKGQENGKAGEMASKHLVSVENQGDEAEGQKDCPYGKYSAQ